MMGMSFASVLGGMTTLIGSSTNLLVAGSLVAMGRETLDFFTITLPGLYLAFFGMLYILLVMPRLLRSPRDSWGRRKLDSAIQGKRFVAQFMITGDSPFVGKVASVRLFSSIERATVVLVQRGESSFTPPDLSFDLRAGDILLISASRKRIDELVEAEEHGLLPPQLSGDNHSSQAGGAHEETILAEFFHPATVFFCRSQPSGLALSFPLPLCCFGFGTRHEAYATQPHLHPIASRRHRACARSHERHPRIRSATRSCRGRALYP